MPQFADYNTSDPDENTIITNTEAKLECVLVPVGAILPWAKSISGVPALPGNFVECNGQTLSDSDSLLNGETIPDLNGDHRFLYGNSTSGTTKTEDLLPNHNHHCPAEGADITFQGTVNDANAPNLYTDNESAGTAWQGYSIVWIIRVK